VSTLERWGGSTVLVVEEAGPPIDGRAFRDLVGDAMGEGASMLAVPVDRLPASFWELASGLAGDLLQVSVNYQLRLAVVGELPEAATASRAFAALVRESNAATQHWFLPSLGALRLRLESGRPAPRP
jgi:hypothetical protein